MTTADALGQATIEGPLPERWYDTWFTTGSWTTEEQSASAFDRYVDAVGLFRMYREVVGTLIQPRPGQRDRSMRIDRILVPGADLAQRGWTHGAIGVELKRSGISIGPPLAQAMDYVRGSWSLNGVWIQLNAVFLWPMHKQSGPLASLMVHNRVGSVSHSGSDWIKFALGEEVLLANNAYSGVRVGNDARSGRQVGSR